MARTTIFCTVFVVVVAVALIGVQAAPQAQPEDGPDEVIKGIEQFINDTIEKVKDALEKGQEFKAKMEEKIREFEDSIVNQLPQPLGGLVKDIVNKIRETQERNKELAGNMTQCLTDQQQATTNIVKTTMDGIKTCVDGQTAGIKDTISDLEGLNKQGLSLLQSIPKELMSCVKFPPTMEAFTCIITKGKEMVPKALMLVSSIMGDISSMGQKLPEIIGNTLKCGSNGIAEAQKQLGEVIEKIGACEKDVINKQM